jgi:protein-S-isoprenylcysteine O-methyltransferase Ste14
VPETANKGQSLSAGVKTAVTVVAVVGVFAYMFWTRTVSHGHLTPSRAVGFGLAVLGLAGWAVARIQLGKSFSIQARATELVTHGIYSKIRNPVFVLGTILIVGIILWIGQPIYLLVLLVIVPMQVIRARKEAQVLEARFGDAYRAYRSRTWFWARVPYWCTLFTASFSVSAVQPFRFSVSSCRSRCPSWLTLFRPVLASRLAPASGPFFSVSCIFLLRFHMQREYSVPTVV